ncbi:MAG: 2-C-methyl-D-erythritol 2,4-cyclodiphosphate synthase [Blastocatellia bacterium]|nr:2-C-methyl-D-erythritol 2,4-cyclodiphosphate synthase [Blastocatellia bacterium]
MTFRVGFGTDIHRLIKGRALIIGGVEIESDLGSEGHSDADVLLHAVTDAILGALALGDIGAHFPNTDDRWRDASSHVFLKRAAELMREHGYELGNADCTIHLEAPKLRPYIDRIRAHVAAILITETENISVKAKTGEGVDAVGEGRAVRADATVLLHKP